MVKTQEDLDFSGFAQKFTVVREERDMLRSQLSDLEKSHAVAESKAERLEKEVETLRAQIDSLKAKVVEKETVIQGIAATILTHVNKEKGNNETRILGSPARPRFLEIEQSIAQLGRKLEDPSPNN